MLWSRAREDDDDGKRNEKKYDSTDALYEPEPQYEPGFNVIGHWRSEFVETV